MIAQVEVDVDAVRWFQAGLPGNRRVLMSVRNRGSTSVRSRNVVAMRCATTSAGSTSSAAKIADAAMCIGDSGESSHVQNESSISRCLRGFGRPTVFPCVLDGKFRLDGSSAWVI
ncbi:hypothetical protein [Nocardia sp. NPDC049526]|uniref:hypothetical protein n=1 Tax=Nocardia sp. NPDC049526 TaxID=3364316 RepID=UPI0037A8716A